MSIDITPVLEALIALMAALVAGRLLPWLRERLTAQRMERLEAACNIAVYAAEELFRAGHGQEKLNYAQEYLKSRSFEVDTARLLAAVRRMREAGLEEGRGTARQGIADEEEVGAANEDGTRLRGGDGGDCTAQAGEPNPTASGTHANTAETVDVGSRAPHQPATSADAESAAIVG